jgi:hypothetical protein
LCSDGAHFDKLIWMRAWLPMIVIASACSDNPSVIEVRAPGAASIEVMIANGCYTNDGLPCAPGIAWEDPALPFQPPADVFIADRDDRLQFTVRSSGIVTVQLRPSSPNDDIDRLVFIAFDQFDNALAFAYLRDVHLTSNEVWVVDLDPNKAPIADIGTTFDGPTTSQPDDREHVWRPPATDRASCVARQSWRSDLLAWDREVYVAPSDFDCDGFANDVDCDPAWYLYGRSLTLTPFGCALPTNVAEPNACTVGTMNPPCVDNGTSTPACHAATTVQCVPDAMCTECPIFAAGCGVAAVETVAEAGRMPYITCDIAFDTMGQPCTSQNNDTMTIDLTSLGPACARLVVYPRDWPPQQGTAAQGIVKVSTSAYLTESASACMLGLKFENGTAPASAPNQPFILGIDTANGVELDIPLLLHFEAGCENTTHCSMKNLRYDPSNPDNSDGVWSCLL